MSAKYASEYLVVFGKSLHWSARFLNSNISHVMVFVMSKDGKSYIRLDPHPTGLRAENCFYNEQTMQMIRLMNDVKVLKLSHYRTRSQFAKFGFMTCVDVVQYILGVKFRWCWTPRMLYKRLLKHVGDPDLRVTVVT